MGCGGLGRRVWNRSSRAVDTQRPRPSFKPYVCVLVLESDTGKTQGVLSEDQVSFPARRKSLL